MTAIDWTAALTAQYIPWPDTHTDKYRRGVLALRTGSTTYPGAAVLGAEAAWRAGLGLLRFIPQLGDTAPRYGLPTPAAAVLAARPETVFGVGHEGVVRCDAWVIGSGTDPVQRSDEETGEIRRLLTGSTPVVLDAGGLSVLGHDVPGAPVIITPHHGEFLALWRNSACDSVPPYCWPLDRDSVLDVDVLTAAAARLATHLGVTVLLKGSMTVAATPGGFVAVAGPGTPLLATAGTGDVLAGVLGALIAAHSTAVIADPEILGGLGASAAVLHDSAARLASDHGALPITAMDVAEALPAAVAAIRTTSAL